MTKALISVTGQDTTGIIARVATKLSELNINILDISQTIVQGYFNMMMIVLIVALFVSGFLSIFILPKMKYKDSFMLSGLLGLIIGLITIITTTDILVIIPSMVLCAIITGIGGLVAQFIVHKIIGRFFGR